MDFPMEMGISHGFLPISSWFMNFMMTRRTEQYGEHGVGGM